MLSDLQLQAWECRQCIKKHHGAAKRCDLHAGLEEIAERGRDQLEEHQFPAETSGEPESKEELVDSEYGGGQDTEPLRPSSTGVCLLSQQSGLQGP